MQPRARYIHELSEVERALLQLSAAVERAIVRAMGALLRNDAGAARRIVREDDEIDARRAAVEERVLHLIAGQQPFATDLRFLLAALRIADDLERIGDYAEGIAALVVRSAAEPPIEPPALLKPLTEQVQQMLKLSVAAFVARDPDAVVRLNHDDDRADELNRAIQVALLQRIQSAPHEATRALYFLFVAHNLERIADRAVNIAERTAFIVTGAQPKLIEGRV
jgi:phosphate transport system protein